jgi:hypothetical protein
VVLPMALVLVEPDLGSSMMFAPILAGMLLVAGVRLRILLLAALVGILLGAVMWSTGIPQLALWTVARPMADSGNTVSTRPPSIDDRWRIAGFSSASAGPRLVVSVFVEHGGSGHNAAPIAKALYQKYLAIESGQPESRVVKAGLLDGSAPPTSRSPPEDGASLHTVSSPAPLTALCDEAAESIPLLRAYRPPLLRWRTDRG